jgi:hypothetical protein
MNQQTTKDGELFFDLWRNNYWIGMAKGKTPEEARKNCGEGVNNIIMTPYYGKGTSQATYKALLGVESNN